MKTDRHRKKRNAAEIIAAGEKLFGECRYRDAIAEWGKILGFDRSNAEAANLIKKAKGVLEWTDTLRERGADFKRRGERLRAAEVYAELLKLQPGLAEARRELDALDRETETINAVIRAGEEFYARRDYDGAMAKWAEALVVDPGNSEVNYLIDKAKKTLAGANGLREKAREYARSGQLDPAARTYEELLRLMPASRAAREELDKVNEEIRRANAGRLAGRRPERAAGEAEKGKAKTTAGHQPRKETASSAAGKSRGPDKTILLAGAALVAVISGLVFMNPDFLFSFEVFVALFILALIAVLLTLLFPDIRRIIKNARKRLR
ncbi:MAG: hypothetical protein HY796_02580 [Elusimicrobia bacterium]|nr:hypothetical protein [Elusimicrobiota bacterium]